MIDPSKFIPIPPVRTLAPSQKDDTPKTSTTGTPQGAKNASSQNAARTAAKKRKKDHFSSIPFWIGLALSVLWVAVVALAMMQSGSSNTFAGYPLAGWAIGISAIASPVGLIWMVTAYLQRAADVQSVAEPLRRQLMMITGESGAAEIRIRRFNKAIHEQLELLRSTQSLSQNDLAALMDRVRQHKSDLEQFEQHSVYQVKEIQEVIRRSMQHIEQLFEDKFTMLRILDSKLVQSGDEVSRQTESVREQVTELLQELEANAHIISISVEKASRDSKKLADTAKAQETSLVSATEAVSCSMQELSGKIDLSIAHFLERVGTAHNEAERLSSTLDAQTRTLDEISNTFPTRINETDTLLRGVTDRLMASEQAARSQAQHLSSLLGEQAEGLEKLLDKFGSRLNDIDGGLQQRRSDLDGLVVRISGATDDLAQQLDRSISQLGDRAQNTLRQFSVVNEEARKGADDVASIMNETSARYEDAIRQLNGLAEGNGAQIRSIADEMAAQLKQFEALQNVSQQAGQDVQARANVALQNLQHVLERLLAARDATQSVGETLTSKLRLAVDQNDHIISRINEAAQMTVHALGVAAESLMRKEGEIASQTHNAESALRTTMNDLQEQAQAAEKTLRDQNNSLMELMKETQTRLDSTEARMQDFATRAALPVQGVVQQIEHSTNVGSDMLDRYNVKMVDQLSRLQQLNDKVGTMGDEVGRMTTDTLGALEQFNNRFLTVRSAQEEAARHTLEQFATMADRLQREVGQLNDNTSKAVTTLQQAAAQVGEQSKELLRETQDSGSKIQIVTSALQSEATQTRAMLQKQADDLNADLSRAERQFLAVGEALKQRTDAAYALLDRMAAHYHETTRDLSEEFDSRATHLGQTATGAHEKVTTLNATLAQQLNLINNGATQIESQSTKMTTATGKTLQQLSSLNEKLTVTNEATAQGAQQVINRLEETNNAFLRQNNALNEAAQNASMMVQKAGTAFGEQASKMMDTTHQVEQSIRGLNAATSAFADQTSQIRASMEQHNQRLVANLNDAVGQLDTASLKMQQAVTNAAQGVDQAALRFNEMTQTSSTALDGSSQELKAIADKAENTLSALGASITQQAASLNLVSEQLSEQHRTITSANENLRTQLLDLFDRLTEAHGEASDVAERSIARLTDSLQQIHRQLGSLSDQSQTALADIRTSGAGFTDQATMMLQHAQQAEQQARTVLSVTSALQDQAHQLREALHAEGERTSELFGAILGKLGAGNAELRDLSSTAEITLTSLQNTVANQSSGLNTTIQQITDRQRSLTTALDSQRDVLNGLLNRLSLAHDETSSVAERSATRLNESTQLITRQIETIDTKAQSALTNVQSASSGFIDEAERLGRHAEQAEQLTRLLCASATTLQDQARQVRESVQTESEQLSGVLGTMLDKIGTSSSTLQDLSTSTSVKLTDVHTLITEQTAMLTGMMQQIGERQRALSTSLDTQRDTMNNLINRLTLAQDETAATAERNIGRMTDMAQQIGQQMEALDEQAQSTLTSLRTASAGFADEAGTLSLQAQQTEQQTRGLLSVTAGMRDQAQQLSESIATESQRAIEQMSGIIAQLDTTCQKLRQQGNNMVGSLDQSVLQITSLAKTTDETLSKHAKEITEISEKAEGRVLEAGEKIRGHFKIVADAGEQTEQQAHKLADTAEHATARLATLRSTLADSDKEGQTLLTQASVRISEIRTTLQNELDHVASISQQAVELVAKAGGTLMEQSDTLRANLASSESALTEAATLVREETVHLPSVLDRSTSHIEATRAAFKEQVDGISGTLVQTADRFIAVTGSTRDTIMEETRNLGVVASTAEQTLRQLNQALSEQIKSIKDGTTQLSSDQTEILGKTEQSIAQLTAASDRLAMVRTNALQTTEKLARHFESIETMATSTTQRMAQAGENLGKQVAQLTVIADRAEGQLSNASQGFREQIERIRSGVQMQIDDINRGLMQITAQLERTGSTLRSATTGTVSEIEKISNRFEHTGKDAANQLIDRTARMRVATEDVAKLLNGFGDQMDVLLDRLSMAGDGIKRHESDLVGRLQTALTHLGSVTERLEKNRVLTADVTDEAVSRLADVATVVDKHLQGLKSNSESVAGIVKGMDNSVVNAQSQVLVMSKSIEEMQQRTDRMRVALKLQGDDLMNTLENILHQLSTTGDVLGDTLTDSLQKKAVHQDRPLA